MNVENGSLWINTVGLPCYPAWNGDREVDVAVIGGGLAGILMAHFLEQAGRKCVVLEADRIGSGQTKEYDGKSDFPTWSDLRETDADGRTRYGTAVCRCQSGGDRTVSDPDPEIWDRMRMGNLRGVFVWN